MATTIKLKNSVTATNAPSSLVQGEVAINVTDKKVWVGNAATTPIQLLGGGADGSFTNISVSSVATFGAGAVGTPAITTTGDTNTGIFFPAADTIAFTEGGVESMRINSSGQVGIGTSSPTTQLLHISAASVSGPTNNPAGIRITDTGTSEDIQLVNRSGNMLYNIATGNAYSWQINSSEVATIDSSGNVGIGTSSPSSQLQMNSGAATYSDQLRIRNTNFGNADIGVGSGIMAIATDMSNITFYTSSSLGTTGSALPTNERMRIDSSGNVGIGTSSPSTQLHMTGSTFRIANDASNVQFYNTANSVRSGYIQFLPSGSAQINVEVNQALLFATNNTERMRITSGGVLCVGATSAFNGNVLFSVQGSGGMEAKATGGTNFSPYLAWNSATSGDNIFHIFYTESSITQRGSIDYNRGAGLVRYNTTSDANLKNIIGDSDGQKSVDILKLTKIREFAWKDDAEQKLQIGVIAQELYETYKGAVSVGGENDKGEYRPWGVDKTAFTFHLIAGWQNHEKLIKDQQALIENLTTRLNALEGK